MVLQNRRGGVMFDGVAVFGGGVFGVESRLVLVSKREGVWSGDGRRGCEPWRSAYLDRTDLANLRVCGTNTSS